jgi:hypothetical protein
MYRYFLFSISCFEQSAVRLSHGLDEKKNIENVTLVRDASIIKPNKSHLLNIFRFHESCGVVSKHSRT